MYATLSLFCLSTNAEVVLLPEKINATKDIAKWRNDFKKRYVSKIVSEDFDQTQTSLTECRETEEVSGAILCLTFDFTEMNRIFVRPTLFSEGGISVKENELVSNTHPDVRKYQKIVGGHDIKSSSMHEFFKQTLAECKSGKDEFCLTKNEDDFYRGVYLKLKQQNIDFAIVTFSVVSSYNYSEVVSHEILHAQYFLDPLFRKITDDFWDRKVSLQDKEAVKKDLGEVYDSKNEFVMKNEFQAYVLAAGRTNISLVGGQLIESFEPANGTRIVPIIKKYRDSLMSELHQAGVYPIQVQ